MPKQLQRTLLLFFLTFSSSSLSSPDRTSLSICGLNSTRNASSNNLKLITVYVRKIIGCDECIGGGCVSVREEHIVIDCCVLISFVSIGCHIVYSKTDFVVDCTITFIYNNYCCMQTIQYDIVMMLYSRYSWVLTSNR